MFEYSEYFSGFLGRLGCRPLVLKALALFYQTLSRGLAV